MKITIMVFFFVFISCASLGFANEGREYGCSGIDCDDSYIKDVEKRHPEIYGNQQNETFLKGHSGTALYKFEPDYVPQQETPYERSNRKNDQSQW